MKSQTIVLIGCCALLTFLAATVSSNPILGLADPKCQVVEGNCPHENVTFWLYSRETRDEPVKLDPANLRPTDFQPYRPLRVLLHGYTGHRDFAPNTQIRPALLDAEDVYVISVDYGALVPAPCYFTAVLNLPLVAKCLAQLIDNIVDAELVKNEDIHLIGFSLGGQVAGQVANYVTRKLHRITGLDPAKPMFVTVSDEGKLDPLDADFVDVIHTDVLGRGLLRATGHVDFYPNIGPYQPGCREDHPEDPGSCNHERAPIYYAESIRLGRQERGSQSNGFWGYHCQSWMHYMFGVCFGPSQDALMGYYVNESVQGSYFLRTNPKAPFALGVQPRDANLSELEPQLTNYLEVVDDSSFEPQLRKVFTDEV